MVMKKFYDEHFPTDTPLNFANWFTFAFPMSLCFLAITYLVFKFLLLRNSDHKAPDLAYCKTEYQTLGKMSFEEKSIAWIFLSAVVLWFTLDNKSIWGIDMVGWKTYLVHWHIIPDDKYVNESFVAILMGMILFFFPSKNKKGENLVTWEDVKRLPLGILFLFGGGFALAKGVEVSGLDDWIAGNCAGLKVLPPALMILCLCIITTIFSEFASNTATVSLFMAIMLPIIPQLGIPPLLAMMPITIAASYSFMLPVGTPPNTIVFGTEMLNVRTMLRVGLWLDVLGAVIILLFTLTMGKLVFGF
jgi:sodium-dependent dicarboxylate transporter 2/3/5